MEDILTNPLLWGGLVLVIVAVIVISIKISKKRALELEELDKMFPEGHLIGENVEKISVERVRRTTLEREKRKKEQQRIIPQRTRPKKGTKAIPEEDQEIILTEPLDFQPKPKAQVEPERSQTEEKRRSASLLADLAPKTSGEAVNKEEDDAATNRRLYKRSLLNPMQSDEASMYESSDSNTNLVSNPSSIAEPSFESEPTRRSSRSTRKKVDEQNEAVLQEAEGLDGLPSRSKRKSKKKFF